MARLVAIDLPGGPALVARVQAAWEAGDAVLIVDRRLPPAARTALLDAARPTVVVTEQGDHTAGAPPVELAPGDALVAASSGSTGAPKLLVHTLDGLRAHAEAVHAHLTVDPSTDRWLACLPLNHLGGFGVVARSLLTGVGLDVLDGFDASTVAAAPTALGSTLVSLVPTALDRIDPAAFRVVVLGGSADPATRPPNVLRTYGLTETGGGVVYDGTPLPGTEVLVDATGGLLVRGPSLARGRLAPDGTVTPIVDDDGWLHTGDLGRWDGERLHVDGRADDLIVTGGENVWPGPVEEALRTHPSVADVAVAGALDPTWGQRVVAVVVPRDPAAPPTLEALRDHVRTTLPASSAPRELRLVDALPRTALGKVRRAALLLDAPTLPVQPRRPGTGP